MFEGLGDTLLPKPSWVAYPAVNVVQILSMWTGVNEILLHASHAMVPKHLQEILFSKTIKFKCMFVYGTLHFAKDFFELLFEFNFMISCTYDATSRKML